MSKNRFLRLLGALVAAFVFGTLHSPTLLAAEQIVILGDGNTWKIRHRATDSQKFLGSNADRSPCATVAAALESASLTNRVEFDACFANLDSESRLQWAERLFNEWQSDSRGYSHLIVDEAIVPAGGAKSTKAKVAAVSLVPFVSNDQGGKIVTVPGVRPTAVLLTNVSSKWMITVPRQGEPVLSFLTKEALRLTDSGAFVRQTVQNAAERREAYNLLARELGVLEIGGHPAPLLGNGARERFELKSRGVLLTNWAAWKEYYNCEELNPPATFDARDAWKPDFSTPLLAQRSYRHALHVADGKTLRDHMDASARDSFTFTYGTNWVSRTNYILLPKITQVTVLFTATTKFEGAEYASVFIRAQEASSPVNGIVTFQSDIFKRTPHGYLKSADLDYSSLFGNPGQAAHLKPMFMPRYPKFLEQASKSEFPEYYYRINE